MALAPSKSAAKGVTVVLPKLRGKGTALASTPTFVVSNVGSPIPNIATNSHLVDPYNFRATETDDDLIARLMRYDPDCAAAVGAFLTVANTQIRFLVTDVDGLVDREGHKILNLCLEYLTQTQDYSGGFTKSKSLDVLLEKQRYSILKRGAFGGELVLDSKSPTFFSQVTLVDAASLEWQEDESNKLKPKQKQGSGDPTDLDIANFFYAEYRQDPSSPYSKSLFISAINTVFARAQIINDLYDIMRVTGYPRMAVKLLSDVVLKNAPQSVKTGGAQKQIDHFTAFTNSISSVLTNLNPADPFVHTDYFEAQYLNSSSAMELDITPIIKVLDAQNQAALKSMATILGRGESGVNTASVEARIFSMNAQEINQPIADFWSQLLTLAIRLQGSLSKVTVYFEPVELRPDNELEPSRVQKQARLHKDLSLGMITDDYYHLQMYGTIRPETAPELSGTGFSDKSATDPAADTDKTKPSESKKPSSAERQSNKPADKGAKSNAVK